MLIRLGIAVALLAGGFAIYCAACRVMLWQAAQRVKADPLFKDWRPGRPSILYFTTPLCAPCKTMQRPALQTVTQEIELQVIEVDVSQDLDAAKRWQVQTVPTTFVLDSNGKPRNVNHGVANADKLRAQLSTL